MDGGRLKRCGKSNRSEAPPDGYRSDSSGKLYAFPTQRSSGSVREALRLPRPPGLRNAKIFSHLFRCPLSTHTTCPWMLSGLEFRSVISCRGWCSCWIRLYLSFTPYNRYIRSALFRYQKTEKIPVRAASVDGASEKRRENLSVPEPSGPVRFSGAFQPPRPRMPPAQGFFRPSESQKRNGSTDILYSRKIHCLIC